MILHPLYSPAFCALIVKFAASQKLFSTLLEMDILMLASHQQGCYD